jgi:ABC-type multidrug transport system ATPase subunit
MDEVIELVHVCKLYSRRCALDDVTVTIRRGEVIGLLGSNGAGKSTLLRIVTGLVRPTRGTMLLWGQSPHPSLRRRIGALIERADAYPYLTGAENLEIVLRLRRVKPTRKHIEALLARVGIAHAMNRVVRTYSYGMKQRLGLAIALAGEPELIILDEPVNGLDPHGIADVRALIASLHREGRTVIISSHLLSEVELVATRLVVLQEGRLIADGALEELLERTTTRVTIETVERADDVLAILASRWSAEKIRPHAIRIDAQSFQSAIAYLVGAGIHLRAIIPERSLEQFYFATTT